MIKLLRFLQNEIYNIIRTRAFQIVVLILILMMLFDGVLAYRMYSTNLTDTLNYYEILDDGTFKSYPFLQIYTVYNSWIGGRVNQVLPMIFFYTLPLFSVIPYSWSYLSERKNGYDRSMVTHLGKKTYFWGKYLSAFISGFITVLIPMLLSFVFVCCLIPAYKTDVDFDLYYQIRGDEKLLGNLYYAHPLITVFLNMLQISIFAGAWATVPFALSFYEKNKFIILLAPYLFLMYLMASLELAFAYHSYAETSIIDYIWLTGNSTNQYLWIYLVQMLAVIVPPIIVVLERSKNADVY